VRLAEVNVGDLDGFDAGAKVDEKALREHCLVKGRVDRIKILGGGDLKKKITVTAHAFSKSAVEKIEKAGGKAHLLVAAAAATES
jgi:large subunit ribosomal protein L15